MDQVQVPDQLRRYGPLVLAMTGGAVAASGITWYFQKHQRSKKNIQLIIFRMLHEIENLPDYQGRLQNPAKLIADIEYEVMRTLDLNISKNETKAVVAELKRQVWERVNEEEQRLRNDKRQRQGAGADETNQGQDQGQAQSMNDGAADQDVSMLDYDDTQEPTRSSPPKNFDQNLLRSLPGYRKHRIPSPNEFPSSPLPARRLQAPTPRRGRRTGEDLVPVTPAAPPRGGVGFSYDDEDLYTPSAPSVSEEASPTEQASSSEEEFMSPELSIVEELLRDSAWIFDGSSRPPVRTTKRPSIKDRRVDWRGKRLSNIPEGDSPETDSKTGAAESRADEETESYDVKEIEPTEPEVFPGTAGGDVATQDGLPTPTDLDSDEEGTDLPHVMPPAGGTIDPSIRSSTNDSPEVEGQTPIAVHRSPVIVSPKTRPSPPLLEPSRITTPLNNPNRPVRPDSPSRNFPGEGGAPLPFEVDAPPHPVPGEPSPSIVNGPSLPDSQPDPPQTIPGTPQPRRRGKTATQPIPTAPRRSQRIVAKALEKDQKGKK